MLTINLLAALESKAYMAAVLRIWLGRPDILQVCRVDLEYAPAKPSAHLGDKTRVDALVEIATASGREVIVLETKYIDRISKRHVDITANPRYFALASEVAIWDKPQEHFTDQRLNQLTRCHALAASVARERVLQQRLPTLLLLTHPQDPVVHDLAHSYRDGLREPSLLVCRDLAFAIEAMKQAARTGAQYAAAEALSLRYLEYWRSDPLWLQYRSSSRVASSSRVTPG